MVKAVSVALTSDTGPPLVGLVGDSGSGKTTAASEIARSLEVRQVFCDGIVWLTVNCGAEGRLPSLMFQLASTVYRDMGGSVGCRPAESDDCAAYVKQRMEEGHGGKGLKCLVVADNVWEKEVASKLLETGMSVLVSTREEGVVTGAQGKVVRVDELSEAEAESVLRSAAELHPDVRLPDDAKDLIELCGRVAMDLAFVGRWSTIRRRNDNWAEAAGKIRAEILKAEGDCRKNIAGKSRTERRKAILQAGFDDLAIGSDDERVQRLYLSLAVLPDGHPFTVTDAAVLLHGRSPDEKDITSVDIASAGEVVETLERWAVVLRSAEGNYRMHDAHSSFARSHLLDRGDVRRSALERWVWCISSLQALRSFDRYVLKRLWVAVEDVGGESWNTTRPYAKALAVMDECDPLRTESIQALGSFQNAQQDWKAASATWRWLLNVCTCMDVDMACTLHILGICTQETSWSEEVDEPLKHCLSVKEAKLGRKDVQVIRMLYSLGITVLEAGRLEEAEELLRRCLDTEEEKRVQMDVDQQDYAMGGLGLRFGDDGPLEEAEQLLRHSLQLPEKGELDQDSAHTTQAPDQLVAWVREAGRLDGVVEFLKCFVGTHETEVDPKNGAAAMSLYRLGLCMREARRLDEAEGLFRHALAIVQASPRRTYVEEETVFVLEGLGVCALNAGRIEQSQALLKCSLRLQRVKLGQNRTRVACTLLQLGKCARQARELSQAVTFLRRCVAFQDKTLDAESVQRTYAMLQLGLCLRDVRQLEEAEELMRRCLAIRESKLGPDDEEVAHTLYQLGWCVRAAGRLEEAEELLKRCLAIQQAKLGAEDRNVAATRHQLDLCARETTRRCKYAVGLRWRT